MAWVSLSRCSNPAKSRAGDAGGPAACWTAAAAGVERCSAGKGLADPPPRGLLELAVPAILGRVGLAVAAAGDGAGGDAAADDAAVGAPAVGVAAVGVAGGLTAASAVASAAGAGP